MKTMHRVNILFLCFCVLLYILSISGQVAAQSFLVTPLGPNTHPSNGSFGVSSSISGITVVIGAKDDDDRGTDAGAAYVFVRSGSGWIQQAKLTASDGAANDQFGHSVAISGDTVVVGAHLDGDGGRNSGSAYVFVRVGTSWIQEAKLVAGDAGEDDQFGAAVAISEDTIAVGSLEDDDLSANLGAAYVFVRNGSSWSQQAKFKPVADPFRVEFGHSVAISGDTIVVGFRSDNGGSGSAYVFVRSGTSWTQQTKLTANDAASGDQFGEGVGISGDTVVVGAQRDDDVVADAGSAYVFVRVGTSWTQEAKLTASDPAIDRRFGGSVAIDGNTLVVEAVRLGGGTYVFERTGSTWVEQIKLTHGSTPGNPTPNRLSVSGHRIVSSNFVFESANQSPVADAGPDQTVECANPSGANVTLNGSASSDPDGDPLTFTWTGPSGTQTGEVITVTLAPGTHTITLTVDDDQGGIANDTVTVTVSADTAPPVPDTPTLPTVMGQCSATVTPPTATDNCAGSITGTTTDPLSYLSQGNYTVHWTYDDGNGNIATQTQTVIVQDTTPPMITACAANGTLSAGANCQAAVPDLTGEIVATDNCSPVTITQSPAAGTLVGTGNTLVTLRVRDTIGNESICTATVTVVDTTPPVISCPISINVAGNIPGSCGANVNVGPPVATDNCVGVSESGVRSDGIGLTAPYPLGATIITWTALDMAGNMSTCSQTVTVTNPSPAATISSPSSGGIFAVGTPVNFTGSFTDNPGGTHSAQWTFDTITQAGTVNESDGSVSASFTFTAAGVYLVTLTVSDGCGGTGTVNTVDGLTAMVVIYDPDGGFVTGGGWINSPAGAYIADPSLTGKANFGFVSRYQHGATVPTGQTEFQFKVANLNLHSTVYEWLVVAGARAQYKGTGTINGGGNYGFLLTAIDGNVNGGGGVDKFRIKIWNKDNNDVIVYDNKIGSSDNSNDSTELGGGSIVIHD